MVVLASQVQPIFENSNYSIFGLDNYAIFYVFPMLAAVCFSSLYLKGRITNTVALLYGLCLVCKIITFALTSVIVLGLFGIILLLISRGKCHTVKLFTLKSGALVLATATIAVIVFRCDRLIMPVLELIGKTSTVESRVLIWQKSIDAITHSPVFGFGKMSDGLFQLLTGFNPTWDVEADHTHNGILEILFSTGFVGLILISLFIYGSFRRDKGHLPYSYIILECAAFSCMLMMISDAYPCVAPIYVLPALAACLNHGRLCNKGEQRGKHMARGNK